jgi:hypothetical protein
MDLVKDDILQLGYPCPLEGSTKKQNLEASGYCN